jgi:hypothetical protein
MEMNESITRRELLERVSKVTVAASVAAAAPEASGSVKGNAALSTSALREAPAETPEASAGGAQEEAPEIESILASGGRARSWEPGVRIIPQHEPAKAFDSSLHTYWAVSVYDLPADLGIEWPEARTVSSVVIRYFDGRMVRGPAIARTQQWARLQYWENGRWNDIAAEIEGQETCSVRYTFSPLTTTRLRILFTEPPDPESRRTPEPLGIYVCEFEVYPDVPFQVVDGAPRLVQVRGGGGNHAGAYYNEWGSDNPYDRAGPLVIEQKRPRTFSDALSPTLIVSESQWAEKPCSIDRPQQGRVTIENGFLRLEVQTAGEPKEIGITNVVTGEHPPALDSHGFRIRTSRGELNPGSFKLTAVDTSGSSAEISRLRVSLTSGLADVSVFYELNRRDHFYHKWLTLTNKTDSSYQVLDVTVSTLGLPRTLDLMAGPELTYPICRLEKGGFFECLETVYWDHIGDALTYYPGSTLAPGKALESDKATVGVYRNRGETIERFDRGVREWVIEYHARVSPIAKEWPDIYIEGWSANFGVREVEERPEWAERFFATAHKMGVRYMDTVEPTDLGLLMPEKWQQRWVDLANRYDIGTGWWNDFGNSYSSDQGHGWGVMVPYLKPYLCKLSPEAEEYFQNIVNLVRRYKLRGFHWADFWTVWRCDNSNHGHLPGKYSIYAQGQRMVRFNEQMHAVSPGLIVGADSGLDNPQYGRHADSRHHGGGWDAVPTVEPDIHLDRLYAEMNRDYLYGLAHQTMLRPWFRLLNCVNHFGAETHHHDSAGFRYALVSAIALAPQLTFNDAPEDIPQQDMDFARKWEEWAKAHQDYLKHGDRLFDRTYRFDDRRGGDPSLTGYAHIRKDRGYVFLINPDAVEHVAELTLSLDAPRSERFFVEEIFPGGMTLRGPNSGAYPQREKLRVTVPAKQVRILWIAPSSSGAGPANLQPEDARAAQWRRYLGHWTVAKKSADSATLCSEFLFPESGRSYLSGAAAESAWANEPWNYAKAYLVLLLKDETRPMDEQWVPDNVPITAQVNGMAKSVRAFRTGRMQEHGLTRCYFIALEGETKPGDTNQAEVTVPIQRGLVFSGAYLDLPDQMPVGMI